MTDYPYSYYKTQAQSIHQRWIDSLRSFKDVTEPTAKQMIEEDLKEISSQADKLLSQNLLHPLDAVPLLHIVQRAISQHIVIAKHAGNPNVIKDNRNPVQLRPTL